MQLLSPQFPHEGSIPSKYTCDGENVHPPLRFEEVPEGAVSLALIMDDPDVPATAGVDVWDHWVVWNMPAETRELLEHQMPPGTVGLNTRTVREYGGPCPPDREHRYFFRLYALDTMLDLPGESTKADLLKAMEGHVLETAELMGRYERNR